MKKYRLFIAINLNDIIKSQISEMIGDINTNFNYVKWVKPENLHITLKFLGDTPEEKLKDIKKTLLAVALDHNEFSLVLADSGVFPDFKGPRVIWLGISQGKDNVKAIRDHLEDELVKTGFSQENKEFKGHITLGRVKKPEKNLAHFFKNFKPEPMETQKITAIDLMKSTLYPSGPVYDILETYPLKKI